MPLLFGITIPALPRTSDFIGVLLFGVLTWIFTKNDTKTIPASILVVSLGSGLLEGIPNGMIAGFTVTVVLSLFFGCIFLMWKFIQLIIKYIWRTSKEITKDAVLAVSPTKDEKT